MKSVKHVRKEHSWGTPAEVYKTNPLRGILKPSNSKMLDIARKYID